MNFKLKRFALEKQGSVQGKTLSFYLKLRQYKMYIVKNLLSLSLL